MLDLRALAKERTRELAILSESALRTLREARSASDLPLYGGQLQFADFLDGLFVALQTRLATEVADIAQDLDEDIPNHLRTLNGISFLINLLVSAIGWIGVAPNLLVSSALSPHLSRLGSEHLESPALVVISPTWEINYFNQDLTEPLTRLSPLLDEIQPGSVEAFDGFCLLGIPASEAENVLLHAVLYHELGHKVDDTCGIAASISENIKAEVQQFVPESEEEKGVFKDVLGAWTSELVADALATAWVGPSALVALRSLQGSPTDVDVMIPSHPTERARLDVMKRIMMKSGAWECFEEYLPRQVEVVTGLMSQEEDAVMWAQCPDYFGNGLKAAYKALKVLTKSVAEAVWDVSEPTRVTWDKETRDSIDYCLSLLRALIVPLRRGPSADDALLDPHVLLLAGWSHLINDELNGGVAAAKGAQFDPSAELKLRLRHARIVEKALQDVELVNGWADSLEALKPKMEPDAVGQPPEQGTTQEEA